MLMGAGWYDVRDGRVDDKGDGPACVWRLAGRGASIEGGGSIDRRAADNRSWWLGVKTRPAGR